MNDLYPYQSSMPVSAKYYARLCERVRSITVALHRDRGALYKDVMCLINVHLGTRRNRPVACNYTQQVCTIVFESLKADIDAAILRSRRARAAAAARRAAKAALAATADACPEHSGAPTKEATEAATEEVSEASTEEASEAAAVGSIASPITDGQKRVSATVGDETLHSGDRKFSCVNDIGHDGRQSRSEEAFN